MCPKPHYKQAIPIKPTPGVEMPGNVKMCFYQKLTLYLKKNTKKNKPKKHTHTKIPT